MPEVIDKVLVDAFQRLGYDETLLGRNVNFNFIGRPYSPYLESAPLVAFWDRPFDQLTSAIGVRWIASNGAAFQYVDALRKYLWVPYSLVARPDYCEIWEALPTNGMKEPIQIKSVPYSELASELEMRRQQLGPLEVSQRKMRWRQMSLYEVSMTPNAFLEWAFRPTSEQLKQLLTGVLQEGLRNHLNVEQKARRLRWLLRFTGVRIAWDKDLLPTVSRVSEEELVRAASRYPSPLDPSQEAYRLAEDFIDRTASINFGIAEGGLLSQVFQTHGLVADLREEWKLYPTPPDIAWQMLETIPLEAIPTDNRLVWDGTCGTGTLVVVSMERLRQLDSKVAKDSEQLRMKLIGNDRQPLLADLTRIALDTALGKLEGPNWTIQTRDVLEFELSSFERRPTIIVGNPPFEAKGPRADLAIHIIGRYIEILQPGGLLAVVMPRTLLGASGSHALELREKLIREFELFELWELPQGFAPGVSSEAAIICGRKKYPHERQRSAIVWKLFEPHRRIPPLTDVVSSADVWLHTKSRAFDNPLMLRLRTHFKECRRLSDVISARRITQGITPGAAGSEDILATEESGAQRYIAGRTDMAPFYIPWRQRPKWIRYSSPRLERPRRQYENLFQRRKTLIARLSTGGSPWAIQAAVDEDGLYPSSGFIAISPEPLMSCELVAALLNSALINCWLRLANPSRSIRVEECRSIPLPIVWPEGTEQRIKALANDLTSLRNRLVTEHDAQAVISRVEEMTLELDEVVYDAYEIPKELRAEISGYLSRHGKPRPGFDSPLVKVYEIELPKALEVFTLEHSRRMRILLEARKQRQLTADETLELDHLIELWEKAQILSSTAALNKERPEWSTSFVSPAKGGAL